MSAINQLFSDYDINVAAQYLQTSEHVGYVVVDVEGEFSDDALNALKAISGTIRCRVLF